MKEKVLVTGGAGYVGSVLVEKLVALKDLDVSALDVMLFGDNGLASVAGKCKIIKGDIRDTRLLEESLTGIDYVIHLAAIANDPCSNLNPELTKQVNFEATKNIARIAKEKGAKRLIYASSSSVYGIKEEPKVTEELTLEPLTIYSKTKAWAEDAIKEYDDNNFTTVSIRSATVCGYSPRQRLDVIVNILASDAITKKIITVNGGEQKRPNVHIDDLANLYADLIHAPKEKISAQVFNYGKENYTVNEIADMVKKAIGDDVVIRKNPKTADSRSYNISSEKIENALGVYPKHTITEAVYDLKKAFERGLIPNPEDTRYRNVARMKEINFN
ncbi:L-arabinose 1-dehydrogenase (NAD(P)(+)) [uncultured archaeon]|nr:L-arabinose 1-dehydrogenase (NAD(P)(+)) [uncultured archaeon]